MFLTDVNFLAVIVAAILNGFVGYFWYSPMLLGDFWVKAHKFDVAELKATPMHIAGALLVGFIVAWVLCATIHSLHVDSALGGVKVAFFVWLGFVATTQFSGVIWAKKPLKAYGVDVGFFLVSMCAMGAIFGAWQ